MFEVLFDLMHHFLEISCLNSRWSMMCKKNQENSYGLVIGWFNIYHK